MTFITKNIKQVLAVVLLAWLVTPVFAQVRPAPSTQLRAFYNALAEANLSFTFPDGFREIKAVTTEAFPFDYAMDLPGEDFEIWFRVNTQKQNERLVNDKNIKVSTTDSLFVGVAQDQIAAFTTEKAYFKRSLPGYILDRYNADAGVTYMLNLNDSQTTKHYKYALLIVLQKNAKGTVLAICFTNEKGPDFFKNMNKAGNCLKFKS